MRSFPITVVSALALVLAVGPVFSRDPASPAEDRSELPDSVLRVERQTGGEVLRAERMQRDGREVYRLKVLTPDGRVRILRDDPQERRRDTWRGRDQPRQERPDVFESRTTLEAEPLPERPAPARDPLKLPESLPPPERGDSH